MDMSSKSRKTIATASASGSSSSLSSTKGVQKLYSKIRHKIEDIPPKITAKLQRTPKVSPIQTSRPVAAPRTKRRNQRLQQQNTKPSSSQLNQQQMDPSNRTFAIYENIKVSSNPQGLLDSDEDCQPNLNDSTLSLEDEIFEELEKVAHDEAKLNEALKNFDKILADFNDRPASKAEKPAEWQQTATITKRSSRPEGFKQLQKSKTCSIIESRCILKNSILDPSDSTSEQLSHYRAYQLTKSLWSLQDFEEFAKSGKKLEKFECKLPVHQNSTLLLRNNSKLFNEKTPTTKRAVPKATSVWELSTTLSPPSYNGCCHRTSSGSKIPIKKPSSRLAASGRSNSFVDSPISVNKTKFIQGAKMQSIKSNFVTRAPVRSTTEHTLNTNSAKLSIVRPFNRTPTSLSPMSRGNSSINLIKKRALTAASSTPNSLHKVGIPVKQQLVKSASISPGVSTTKLTLKTINNNETSVRSSRYTKNNQPKEDILLDKCLKKGHQILRKVEAFGSVTRIDKIHSPKRDFITTVPVNKPKARSKDDTMLTVTTPTKTSTPKNFTLIIVDKLESNRTKQSKGPSVPPKPPGSPGLRTLSSSALDVTDNRSCLTFGKRSIVSTNDLSQPTTVLEQQPLQIPINDSGILLNATHLTSDEHSEKEYLSDCSDDSGHISNENDDPLTVAIQRFAIQKSQNKHPVAKGVKISELLEKFEKSQSNKLQKSLPPISPSSKKSTTIITVPPKTPTTATTHMSVKVAEIKPCIKSTVEIYPTFSNEVIIQIQ